jgi:hypothetical protein
MPVPSLLEFGNLEKNECFLIHPEKSATTMQCQPTDAPLLNENPLLSALTPSPYPDGSMTDSYNPTDAEVMAIRPTIGQSDDAGKTQETEKTLFQIRFIDSMEMYADAKAVADYLDVHAEWFTRCAQPLKTEPLGDNGYVLVIGRYGSFGYEIEPKVGLHLLPQDEGVYRIETIPVPNYVPAGYDIDFRASMELIEYSDQPANRELALPQLTHVQWTLDLTIEMQFPRFIQVLPRKMVQRTGDMLLDQVVKQISRRLTKKVQEDFHSSRNLPLPKIKRTPPQGSHGS